VEIAVGFVPIERPAEKSARRSGRNSLAQYEAEGEVLGDLNLQSPSRLFGRRYKNVPSLKGLGRRNDSFTQHSCAWLRLCRLRACQFAGQVA